MSSLFRPALSQKLRLRLPLGQANVMPEAKAAALCLWRGSHAHRKRRLRWHWRILLKIRREHDEIRDGHRAIAIEISILPRRRRLTVVRRQINEVANRNLLIQIQVAHGRVQDQDLIAAQGFAASETQTSSLSLRAKAQRPA